MNWKKLLAILVKDDYTRDELERRLMRTPRLPVLFFPLPYGLEQHDADGYRDVE